MRPYCLRCTLQEDELKGAVVLVYANKQVKKLTIFNFAHSSEIGIIT
jgi:hypothetical protein